MDLSWKTEKCRLEDLRDGAFSIRRFGCKSPTLLGLFVGCQSNLALVLRRGIRSYSAQQRTTPRLGLAKLTKDSIIVIFNSLDIEDIEHATSTDEIHQV